MQKLVTIYLDSAAFASNKWVKSSNADHHAVVEEHLSDLLQMAGA